MPRPKPISIYELHNMLPRPRPRPVHTFEIHTDLPVWFLNMIDDLLITVANLTGHTVHFSTVTESYNDQATLTNA